MSAITPNIHASIINPAYGQQMKPGGAASPGAVKDFGKAFHDSLRSRGVSGVEPAKALSQPEQAGVSMVGGFIQQVDAKSKVAEMMRTDLLTGQSDNIHQTMVALQEAGIAFSLMVEVRNKLLETYQELMRMQV